MREAAGDPAVGRDPALSVGADCTRPSRMIASCLPMFSPVTTPNRRPPSAFSVKLTAGWLFSSIVGRAFRRSLPVTAATFLTR